MNKNTIFIIGLLLIVTIISVCDSAEIFNEYDDPVINWLLNGESLDYEQEEALGNSKLRCLVFTFVTGYFYPIMKLFFLVCQFDVYICEDHP